MDIESANREAIDKIKSRCHLLRITPIELCGLAKVGRVTFWRADTDPAVATTKTLRKLEEALAGLEAKAKAQ